MSIPYFKKLPGNSGFCNHRKIKTSWSATCKCLKVKLDPHLKMGNDDLNHHSSTMMTSSASTSQSSSYSSISASSETPSYGSVVADSTQEWKSLSLGSKFRILRRTDQVHELQTRLRDIDTSRSDFKFVADRLIRMVIEEGLNQLRKYPMRNCEAFFSTTRFSRQITKSQNPCVFPKFSGTFRKFVKSLKKGSQLT